MTEKTKTISLAPDRAAEKIARTEGKTLNAVVQVALRKARAAKWREELGESQDYCSNQAKGRGIITEGDLARYLES
jgi:hypothetical protein